MDILHTACFTGHRPHNLGLTEGSPGFNRLWEDLEYTILELVSFKGITTFISGMALGVDMYAAQIVLKIKERNRDVKLICALPCSTQSDRWSELNQYGYKKILRSADKVICLQDFYTVRCMQRRNEFMVDNSSLLIAVWNGEPGGTANTVRYAQKTEKQIIRLDPFDYI